MAAKLTPWLLEAAPHQRPPEPSHQADGGNHPPARRRPGVSNCHIMIS